MRYKTWNWRPLGIVTICLLILWLGLSLWNSTAESSIRWTPDYAPIDLSPILAQPERTEQDYQLLFQQTGLNRHAIDTLLANHEEEKIKRIQGYFFATPTIRCEKNSIISSEESVVDDNGNRAAGTELGPLEAGDILITRCSHTFGWRNGHAAIVVDENNGITLESVVLGEDSCTQRVSKWERYPSFMVLRLKDASVEERAAIAQTALEQLNGVPYGFTMGLLTPKYAEDQVKVTHCAHLVWAAFRRFGYDLDSDGGRIVTPKDIANSPLLEVMQVYGANPYEPWL